MIEVQNITAGQGIAKGGSLDIKNEAQLRQVAEQFESMFMNMLLKSMRETVPMSDLIDNQGEIRYYRQMLDEEMSNHMASGPEGLGIATKIIEQFRPQLQALSAETATDETAAAAPVDHSRGAVLKQALAAYESVDGGVQRKAEADGGDDDLHRRAGVAGQAVADTLKSFKTEILDASRKEDLEPELLLAVIMQESAGRPDAVSRVGAQGLMQLMPATAEELGVEDPLDPSQNIAGGARYLSWLNERFAGDLELVLAGYNAGPGNVERAGNQVPDFPETRSYVRNVTALYETLRPNEDAGNGHLDPR